jgi:hypothetical protein
MWDITNYGPIICIGVVVIAIIILWIFWGGQNYDFVGLAPLNPDTCDAYTGSIYDWGVPASSEEEDEPVQEHDDTVQQLGPEEVCYQQPARTDQISFRSETEPGQETTMHYAQDLDYEPEIQYGPDLDYGPDVEYQNQYYPDIDENSYYYAEDVRVDASELHIQEYEAQEYEVQEYEAQEYEAQEYEAQETHIQELPIQKLETPPPVPQRGPTMLDYKPNIPKAKPKYKFMSKGERICKETMERIYGVPFENIRPSWLINTETGERLELDCYNEDLGYAVEYNGIQHYRWPNWTNQTQTQFINQVRRDQYKREMCDRKGIYLISVPYDIPHEDIPRFITEQLPETIQRRIQEEGTLSGL